MAKYVIEGGNKLVGKVKISGNKNAALPCLCAALLTDQPVIFKNIPNISDVRVLLEIFKELGVKVEETAEQITIQADEINKNELPKELVTKLRASILLAGPILARMGEVRFFHPGGDVIGKRTIQPHFDGFKELGFDFIQRDREYIFKSTKKHPKSAFIFLEEASVTATENLIMVSALGDTTVTIKNCAKEPHIVDLCNLLVQMGASIQGIGESTLTIKGVSRLKGAEFTIGSDFIEIGTYAVAAALTEGEVELENCQIEDLQPVTHFLDKMGVEIKVTHNGTLKVDCTKILAIPKLHTNIWPGFPSDLMSVMIVLATQAEGVSLMHDWMYESRMFFVDKLINMGAHITIADPHRVIIYGPTKLSGRVLESPDIRAGMALVLAALIAEGTSVINKAELIERGYTDVVENLTKLWAKIQRLD